MKSVVKVSKTVESAIDEALKELNVGKEDISTEIIEEPSKGFLGFIGGKDAKVKVTVINDPKSIVEELINMLLDGMRVQAKTIVEKEGSTLYVYIDDISSTDMGITIGRRGNTLDAIQYILSLAVNKNRNDYIRVFVDVKGYRKRREKTLIRLAKKMGQKAKSNNRPIKLEPMNPYERRIIHSALQNVEGINTYSEGEDPYRRVVIEAE